MHLDWEVEVATDDLTRTPEDAGIGYELLPSGAQAEIPSSSTAAWPGARRSSQARVADICED